MKSPPRNLADQGLSSNSKQYFDFSFFFFFFLGFKIYTSNFQKQTLIGKVASIP